jgi:hypothetical protein
MYAIKTPVAHTYIRTAAARTCAHASIDVECWEKRTDGCDKADGKVSKYIAAENEAESVVAEQLAAKNIVCQTRSTRVTIFIGSTAAQQVFEKTRVRKRLDKECTCRAGGMHKTADAWICHSIATRVRFYKLRFVDG